MRRGKSKSKGKGTSGKGAKGPIQVAAPDDADPEDPQSEVIEAEVVESEVVRPVIVEPAVVRPQVVDAEVVQPIVIRPRSADEITVVVSDPLAIGSAEAFLANSERTPPPLLVDDSMADYLAEFEDAPTVPDTTPRWAQVNGR